MDSSSGERYKGLKSKKKKRTQRESSVFLKCITRNRSSPDVFIYFNQTSGRVKSQENLYITSFSHSKKKSKQTKTSQCIFFIWTLENIPLEWDCTFKNNTTRASEENLSNFIRMRTRSKQCLQIRGSHVIVHIFSNSASNFIYTDLRLTLLYETCE